MLDFPYSGDIILLLLFLAGFYLGFRMGISRVVTILAAPILGLIAARHFSAAAGLWLDEYFHFSQKALENESLQTLQQFGNWLFGTSSIVLALLEIACFIVIFIVVAKVTRLLGRMLHSLFAGHIIGSLVGIVGGAGAMLLCWALVVFLLNWLFPLFLTGPGGGPVWLQNLANSLYNSQFIWPFLRDFSADIMKGL